MVWHTAAFRRMLGCTREVWEDRMNKLIALICVVSWSGFWAFGYLALSAGVAETGQMVTAALLAAVGFFTGMVAWLKLARSPSLMLKA